MQHTQHIRTTLTVMGTARLAAPGAITMNCGGFRVFTTFKRMFVTRVTAIING